MCNPSFMYIVKGMSFAIHSYTIVSLIDCEQVSLLCLLQLYVAVILNHYV
jgi:hypothetical protein